MRDDRRIALLGLTRRQERSKVQSVNCKGNGPGVIHNFTCACPPKSYTYYEGNSVSVSTAEKHNAR
jgi:hypothetical protein